MNEHERNNKKAHIAYFSNIHIFKQNYTITKLNKQ